MNVATDKSKIVRLQKKLKTAYALLSTMKRDNQAMRQKLARWGRPSKDKVTVRYSILNGSDMTLPLENLQTTKTSANGEA